MRRRSGKTGAILALLGIGVASSCVSATKYANTALKRGREGDDMKVQFDLSLVVQSKDEGLAGADRNIKRHPRNYKFSCAVAPLTIEFRRSEKDKELGEPEENFSQRPPLSRPIEDDERRTPAELPLEDRLAGVPLRSAEDRFAQTAPPSTATPASVEKPPAEAPPAPPGEEPKAPEKPDEEPKYRRVGSLPPGGRGGWNPAAAGTTRRHFAANDVPAAVASDSVSAVSSETVADVGTAASAALIRTSTDELRKISQYEGMNFKIDANGFRKRMADVFREYLLFERVDEIDYTSDQKTLDSLFQQAEANGDDFLLVATLKRNKVSYLGTDFGGAFTDDVLWILFWFPSEFFGFIPRESYQADVELQVKLYDVRSRFAVVDRTFEGHDRLVLTGSERGYQIFGPFTVAMTSWAYSRERLFSTAGEWVRPGAWIDTERQLLDHFYNQLKKELDKTDTPTFDDSTNR
ncbi:hypothetical protein HY251_12210, partial [bacterium]|nr:hypothetical protein [bacterium]